MMGVVRKLNDIKHWPPCARVPSVICSQVTRLSTARPITLCSFLRRKVTPVIKERCFCTPTIERENRTTISICVTLSFFNMSVVASKSMLAPVMGDYNNNRFIFPAPNHSLAELSRSLFVRFFATVRTSLPPRLKRARTLSGHKPARAS